MQLKFVTVNDNVF